MSQSKLVNVKMLTNNIGYPDGTKGRGGAKIDKIFVHHMAGILTAEQCGRVFKSRAASAHYGIDSKGRVGQYVLEEDTAWHCASRSYNQRSIGIELSNDSGAKGGWHVSDKAIAKCVDLIVDICQRNGIKKINYTGNLKGNLCMHRWTASTSCPGPYLSKKFKYIAEQVNKKLSAKPAPAENLYRVRKTWKDAKSQLGAFKSLENAKKACPVGYSVFDKRGKAVYTPKAPDTKKSYPGTFPSYRLKKSNAQVKADAVEWAVRVSKNNNFHYGSNEHAYHNGCYYCGTQHMKKGHGMKLWDLTYCCNPFVGAAWAHGGGDETAFEMCRNCKSWGFAKNEGYEKSPLFDKLGHPAIKKLKPGDVLCANSHVVLYIGDGKIVEAAHRDDNVIRSKKWNESIAVNTLTASRYKQLTRAYRYNGSVNCDRAITHGELSDRVQDLQKFLKWYGFGLKVTGFFNNATLDAVKEFQEKELGKGKGTGVVDKATIAAMKKVKK